MTAIAIDTTRELGPCSNCRHPKSLNTRGFVICRNCMSESARKSHEERAAAKQAAASPEPVVSAKREIVTTADYRPDEDGTPVVNPVRLRRGYLLPGEPLYVFPIYSIPRHWEEED